MRIVTLTGLGLLSASAIADSDIDRTLEVDPESAIKITNTAGSVEVSGWSRSEVEITGEIGSGVEDLIFERNGKRVEIKVGVPHHSGHSVSSDLVIQVPAASSLKINTVSADVDIADVHGEIGIVTVSGDIDADAFESDIQMQTVSGDIELQGDDENCVTDLKSVSGDIDTQNLAGEIRVNSVSGDLVVVNGAFDRVNGQTTNGDIHFDSVLRNDGRMSIETINGDLSINFSNDVSGRFDIETFNGEIDNCFGPDPVRTSQYTPGTDLKFSQGDGGSRVTIRSLNGDLDLCKD